MDNGSDTTPGGAATSAVEWQNYILDGPDVRGFLDLLASHATQSLASGGTTVHCAVMLLRQGLAGSVGSSSDEARAMDEIQYAFAEGPCLSSARMQEVFHVANVAEEKRWPDYMAAIRPAGVTSILAVPFSLSDEAVGSLNLYAEGPGAFDTDAVEAATRYAEHASAALRLALRIGVLRESTEDLHAAMEARTTVDVAVGILMAQIRCSQEEAVAELRRRGQVLGLSERGMAEHIVTATSPGTVSTHFDA